MLAIVTGAVSGMGAATALLFAGEAAVVVVADVLSAEGEQAVGRIKEGGAKARFQPLDVTRGTDRSAPSQRASPLMAGSMYS